MEQKIKSLIFLEIATLILLTWISNFICVESTYNKLLDKNYSHCKKFSIRSYRLLAKCVQNENSSIIDLKEEIPNNGKLPPQDISNNEKGIKEKKKPFNRSSLNKTKFYAEVTDYDNAMFDGKHFHYEKKWIDKKNYDNFVKKDRGARYMALRKLKYTGYRLVFAIFFVFLLFGIGLPTIQFTEVFNNIGTFWTSTLGLPSIKDWGAPISRVLSDVILDNSFLISYVISLVLLGLVIALLVPKIFINNEKYKKLKLRKENYG
ncbi:fam-m protein [Plasmodium malariae]|uniref:Fam-m protein n=1 Tax=Plasmodium malariae TaxID=5858 RepID=A0A1A8XAK1_PLAMA|nr:fam-m protein [Plasmodium malariae]SBT00848.1 PIR Superfamily Protein [Plasmodium malariae]SBT85442.1 fam-m protein [Plasmodium malariae]